MIDETWWGKEHVACIGLGADVGHYDGRLPTFVRYGKHVEAAKVHKMKLDNNSATDDACGYYKDWYIVTTRRGNRMVHKTELCNVPVVLVGKGLHHGNITVVRTCSTIHSAKPKLVHMQSTIGPADPSDTYHSVKAHIRLPSWRCDRMDDLYKVYCSLVTWEQKHSSAGISIRAEQPTKACLEVWGIYNDGRETISPQTYSTSFAVPGMAILTHLLSMLLNAGLAAVMWIVHGTWDVLARVNEEYRLSEIIVCAAVLLWSLPARRAGVAVALYIVLTGIMRETG